MLVHRKTSRHNCDASAVAQWVDTSSRTSGDFQPELLLDDSCQSHSVSGAWTNEDGSVVMYGDVFE